MKPALWDENAEGLLRMLKADGLSFSEMAEEVSKTPGQPKRNRNSVAGKINRLGLCKKTEKKDVKRNKRRQV